MVWDLTAQRESATLRGHENQVYGVALLPDGQTLVAFQDAACGGGGKIFAGPAADGHDSGRRACG